MAIRDLIPWTRSQDLVPEPYCEERSSPFLTLHREMNRLLDEAFRGLERYPKVDKLPARRKMVAMTPHFSS